MQSTLHFLEHCYDVHVLTVGVSSCNKEDAPLSIERIHQAGHRSRRLVRACCSSCKVRTSRPIVSMDDIKSVSPSRSIESELQGVCDSGREHYDADGSCLLGLVLGIRFYKQIILHYHMANLYHISPR